jgi:predicted protein tyrosine phosphatase
MNSNTSPFRVTICGIPELAVHRDAGVTHVLSILDPGTPDPPAFAEFAPHHRLALRFHDIIDPASDQIAPAEPDVAQLLEFGRQLDRDAAPHLLIHCHAGVSRSTASAALILAQADPQRPARDVFDMISQLRPRAWPNLRILEFGDVLLGRGDELVKAASVVYRRALDREPFLQGMMIEGGRSREVMAALLSA